MKVKTQNRLLRAIRPVMNLLVKKGHPDNTPETIGKLRFVTAILFAVVLAIAVTLFTIHIPKHDTLSIFGNSLLLVVFITLIIVSRSTGKYRLIFHVDVAAMSVNIFLGYIGPSAQQTILAAPLVLIYAHFLLGRLGGIVWSIITLITTFTIYGAAHLGYIKLSVDPSMLAQSGLIVILTGIMLSIFDAALQASQRVVREQSLLLAATNKKIVEELKSKEQLTLQLQDTIKHTEENNKFLQNSRFALTNILEDSNDLQEQLKHEKANVEKKIEVRTRELAEEQARLQASIDTLDLGFLMTLSDGSSILSNPAFLKICGFEELAGNRHADLFSQLAHQLKASCNLKASVKKCLATGSPFTIDNLMINGRYIRILGSSIQMRKDHSSLGVVLLVEDMSESKMLERSKDEFVSIASHELRTPLTAIRGNLSLLRLFHADKFKDKETSEMMDDITDSVIRLISIVNQFLTTSRLEQKKTVFEFTAVDTADVIKGVVSDMELMASDKKLALSLAIPKDIHKVTADKSRLQGVLTNLIGNAIKYTDEGSVVVSAENTGKTVTFRVTDTGKGLSVDNQHLLFQKFQQATDNILTRDDSRSTGLGLYITKLMTEQMNGTVQLEKSELGKGSTFSLVLPAA
ncbi:MAG: two-component sensor histidine kinase [Candidatus Saccharibacteria bacterium]|nr:two-component sensor histidine kinase [Candidatus Saccharibacteria bacterium]